MKWWVVVLIVVFLFVVLFRLTLDLLDEKERRGGSFFPHKLESEQTYGEEIYREGAATDEPLAAPAEQVYAVETDSIAAADYRRAE